MAQNQLIQKILKDNNNDNDDKNNKPNIRKAKKNQRAKTYSNSKKNKYNKKKKTAIDLEEKLRYIEITNENNEIYKFCMSKIYNNTNTISYYCQDTRCKARISIKYIDLTEKEDNELINNNTLITVNTIHEHDLKYDEHNYVRNYIIKNDYKNKDRNYISNKCKDYLYRYNILKEIAINYPTLGIKGRLLEKYFIDTYGNIPYNYNSIKPEIKEKLISQYRKINKIENEKNIKIVEVIK